MCSGVSQAVVSTTSDWIILYTSKANWTYDIIITLEKALACDLFSELSLVSLAGHSLLCMLLGLLTALSYSDLVKSWRGVCGGIGIGPYCMYSLPYMYVCACTRRSRQGHCKCT